MKLLRIMLVILFLLLGAVSARATWYWGYTHGGHTDDNDGTWTHLTLKMKAKSMGAQFLIPSGHYDMLNPEERARYLIDFSGYYRGMLLVPGVEFGVPRDDGGTSHLWTMFGAENFFGFTPAENLQELIDQLSDYGAITAAAHPNWKDSLFDYTFDRSVTGFNMVELFNGPYYYEDREFLLDLIRRGRKVSVESGVDSHSKDDPQDAARWLHKTYAYLNGKPTNANLYAAFLNGQTIAVDNYAYPKKFNYTPGFTPRVVNRPVFNIQIGFSKTTKETKTVKVYRDGVLVWDSIRTFLKGKRSITYKWQDNFTQPGIKQYQVEVEGCLFTSPITLQVISASPYPYDPIYDCFVALETNVHDGDESWGELSSWVAWSETDIWPVQNPSDVFFAPAQIEFFVVFQNHIASPRGYPDDRLSWRMNIYDFQGLPVKQTSDGMYSALPWQICWGRRQITLENPGQYLVEVRNWNNTVVLAQKVIWVF